MGGEEEQEEHKIGKNQFTPANTNPDFFND
jgi:hypothetical protein